MKPSQEKVWFKYYPIDSESADNLVPKFKVYNYVKNICEESPESPALQYYGTRISHKKLLESIDEAANCFKALGVKQGDLVSFLTVAFPETVAAIYGLNKIGATANMIDPRMDIESIRRMVKNSGSKILVAVDIAFPKVKPIMEDIAQDYIIVQSAARSLPLFKKIAMKIAGKTDVPYSDSVVNWDKFLSFGKNAVAEEAPYVGDAVVAITFTGGTTGFPKGVMLTNDSMNAVATNFKYAGLYYHLSDRFLGIIPVFTSYGMVCGLHMPLCMHCELVLIPKFDPTKFGKIVKEFRPHHMISTPAFYEMLMDSKEMKGMDLSYLITLGSGGDTMNEGLEAKLNKFMDEHNIRYPLAQGYGMSEVSAAASFSVNDKFKSKSVGIPSVVTDIGIFDPETGEELDYYETGEICISGPTLMKGYYNNPEETENVLRKHSDGKIWVHSGDIGYLDKDGFLFVKGRVKRMITRFDGHKVFPVNIESMVHENEAVKNVCVIGVDDRGHGQGQYPLVMIETEDGADKEKLCKEVFDECHARLEERGKPVAVLSIEKIPLTGSGKNDYRTLEGLYSKFDYTVHETASV